MNSINRPDPEVIAALSEIGCDTVCSTLDGLGIKRNNIVGPLARVRGAKICGPALTLQFLPLREDQLGNYALPGKTAQETKKGVEGEEQLEKTSALWAVLMEVQPGDVIAVGKAFGVFKLKGGDTDFSLPRKDSKVGKGHRGIAVKTDPYLTFADAAKRRDFTVNSMGYDPLTGEILDPYGGRKDLENKILRVTDPQTFPEDPLRPLRAVQFLSRFDLQPDEDLIALTRTMVEAKQLQDRLPSDCRIQQS